MVQRHRLVNDELGQLIRNQDETEPAEDDFRFLGQKLSELRAAAA
jgi:hypothetical protein